MQKPTLCIYKTTHAHWYVWAYKHPMGIYHYLFSITKFETSYIPRGQKQALVNAIKYVCSLTPKYHADIPAWVCGCKGTTKKWHGQEKWYFLRKIWDKIRFQWTKREGRYGRYSRMPFGIIDDVTDARVEVIVRAKRDKNSSYRGERTRARQVGNRLWRKFTQKIYKFCLQKS